MVSVVRNFLPKQDVILVKAEDPRVEFSGIAAGMSGSPVYIDGKLIGAIAYAWAFAKEPLAGVTPIEIDAGRAQPPAPGHPRPGRGRRAGQRPRAGAGRAAGSRQPRRLRRRRWFARAGMPAASQPGPDGLQPVSVPLSISGLSQRALGELSTSLEPYGLVPVRAGGGGSGGASIGLPPAEQRTPGPGLARWACS